MAQNGDSQTPRNERGGARKQRSQTKHLRLLPSLPPAAARPLPVAVPLLKPDQPVTPAQDALLTAIAQRARLGDAAARDLLWRAFAARLEPAMRTAGRMTWRIDWARRNGRPWELDDLRQEAWLVFVELATQWDGEGSFVPYVTAYFPWRLRTAMRRFAPMRHASVLPRRGEPTVASLDLLDAIEAVLSPVDALVLRMRLMENASPGEIARHLGVNRRTVTRRLARIRRIARAVVKSPGNDVERRGPR